MIPKIMIVIGTVLFVFELDERNVDKCGRSRKIKRHSFINTVAADYFGNMK